CVVFCFFTSRRRHTRSKRDWSSDVCSSDLADDDEPTVGGQCLDVAFEVLRADDVEDDIGSGPAVVMDADLVDSGDEVLFAVVDDGVGAEFAAEFGLALGPDGDGDLHAEVACDLDRGPDDSRSAAMDE